MSEPTVADVQTSKRSSRRWKYLVALLLAVLLIALPIGGWVLGAWVTRRAYWREQLPEESLDWLGCAMWARAVGATDLAEHMESKAWTPICLGLWGIDSVEDLSEAQLDFLQKLKSYYDHRGIPLEDAFTVGPACTHLRQIMEAVPWAPEDARRRAFAAKYHKDVPDLAPPLDSVEWFLNTEASPALKGKVVLVDFWGLRCGPCVASMPHVQELWEKHRLQGLVVLGLHCQKRNDNRVRELVEKNSVTYPIGQAPLSLCREFYIPGLPAYFLIDREGRLVHGPSHDVPTEERIQALLHGAPTSRPGKAE